MGRKSKTAYSQIKSWIENTLIRAVKVGPGVFEVTFHIGGDYRFATLSRNSRGKWLATHNAVLDDDDPAYKFGTPEEAWIDYHKRSKA